MQIVITAVGPDNVRLADPIIHYVTGQGANIAEIQMYDHDEEALFAMLLRITLPPGQLSEIRHALAEIGKLKNLGVRVWSPDERAARPRLAICVTYRPETPLAVLRAIRDGQIKAEPAVMIGNRPACRGLAEQFGVPWEMIGDAEGRADDERLVALLDQYEVDYVVLARYMRVLPPASCWYLGDDLRDMKAARAAGMRPIAVDWGYHHPESGGPGSWEADAVIAHPLDLIKHL